MESVEEKLSSKISIKPYVETNVQNLGLEKYNLALFEGTFHEEQLGLIEQNGQIYYLTGLNEFAPSVKNIKDPEEKEAKIKEIRRIVSQLEKEIAFNYVDPNDADFWTKIQRLRPDNHDFWKNITLRCSNEEMHLNPDTEPYDLIKLKAIEAGGFTMVAGSFEEARTMEKPPKFFVDKFVDTMAIKTEYKKLKNKAIAELEKLYNKNKTKLFYVAKVVDANSVYYKLNTPSDVIYDNMDKYIIGQGSEKNVKNAAETFIQTCNADMETLKIKALIKDSIWYKVMATKSDGFIHHMASSTMMGRNVSDCIEFLKNPLNDSVLKSISEETEKYWNNK